MKNINYVAIIGDIKDSKKTNNRYQVQEKLKACLKTINMKYENQICSKFTITLGDEFQGLLHSAQDLLKIIQEIEFEIHPIRLRFGLGVGDITTQVIKENALGSDGPAYHYAREAIQVVHEQETKRSKYFTNIYIKENNDLRIKLINMSLASYAYFFNQWGDDTVDTIRIIMEGKTQEEAAKQLKISQSAVVQRIMRAGYYNYHYLFLELNEVLKTI